MFTKTKQEKLQYCLIAVWKNIEIMMRKIMHGLKTRKEIHVSSWFTLRWRGWNEVSCWCLLGGRGGGAVFSWITLGGCGDRSISS